MKSMSIKGGIVVCGYSGIGKSYAFNKLKKDHEILDSDSSYFSWNYDGDGNKLDVRNENFPRNYVDYIKSQIQHRDIILVSTHKQVRDMLLAEGIDHIVVIPENTEASLSVWREGLVNRGSTEDFIRVQLDHFEEWTDEIKQSTPEGKLIELDLSNETFLSFLEDTLIFVK